MRAALIPLVLLAALTMAGAARKPVVDPTPAAPAASSASASLPSGAPAAAALPTSINDTGLRGQLSPGAKTIPTTLFAHAFAPVVTAQHANAPAPSGGRKISLRPLLAQSDPQVCRSSCARSYYVCLANDQTGYCPSDWSRCLSTCGVAGGAGTLPPLAPPR